MADEASETGSADGDQGLVGPLGSGRRRLLVGTVAGGAVVAGGLVGGVAATATDGPGWERRSLTIDVACLGQLWRESPTRNPADDADFRVPFAVEGHIYPPGTVSDGFVPTERDSIGLWICQGWLMIDGGRGEPHASSTHQYLLDRITSESLFPADTLISAGLEGSDKGEQIGSRAVTGGSGRYLGALGAVRQEPKGFNTTLMDDGTGLNALNFTFTFDLLIPKL